MKRLLTKIKLWYKGGVEFKNHKNDPESQLIMMVHSPSLPKRIIDPLIKFWLRHWQWIIATLIALGVLTVMILEYISKQ